MLTIFANDKKKIVLKNTKNYATFWKIIPSRRFGNFAINWRQTVKSSNSAKPCRLSNNTRSHKVSYWISCLLVQLCVIILLLLVTLEVHTLVWVLANSFEFSPKCGRCEVGVKLISRTGLVGPLYLWPPNLCTFLPYGNYDTHFECHFCDVSNLQCNLNSGTVHYYYHLIPPTNAHKCLLQ